MRRRADDRLDVVHPTERPPSSLSGKVVTSWPLVPSTAMQAWTLTLLGLQREWAAMPWAVWTRAGGLRF